MAIPGFEDITHDLNDYEMKLLPVIAKKLSLSKGEDMAVTSVRIIQVLKGCGHRTTGPRLRKMINVIRRAGMVRNLVASSKGYYVAIDKADAERFIKSLKEREEAIREVRLAMEDQRKYLL